MDKKKTVITVSAFVVFIAVIIGVVCGMILSSPVEISASTAGNFVGNMMNDGYLLEDEVYVFYVNPKDGALYRAESTHPETASVKIADNCNGFLQTVGNKYYFLKGKDLVSCDFNGAGMTTVLENVNKPNVVGGAIYYLNDEGKLVKYSTKYDKTTVFDIKPANGYFVVYFNKIYYSDGEKLCSVTADGKKISTFFEEKTEKFIIDNKYLFFENDGAVYSAMSANGEMAVTKITKADNFYVILKSGTMIYDNDSGVYLANMTSLTSDEKYKPTKLSDKPSKGVFGDDAYFYWFDSDNSLCRVDSDGSNIVIFK